MDPVVLAWAKKLDEKVEFEKIISAGKCYILFTRYSFKHYRKILNRLRAFGDLELVMNVYETRLYYFTAKK